MKKICLILIFILIYTFLYCEIKKQELIKVVIKINSSEYVSYVQLSNKENIKSFKIIKREG